MAAARRRNYFGRIVWGLGTGLAAVLEAGLTVKQYVYVDNSLVSIRMARHHLHQLMVLYPQQSPRLPFVGVFHVSLVMSRS